MHDPVKMEENKDWINFRDLVLKEADTDPDNPLTEEKKMVLVNRLSKIFPDIRKVPDHPIYAMMISRAILELNEKRGSSENAISAFMRKEYKNLPWAHSTFLKHQLSKLCEDGELTVTNENLYKLSKGAAEVIPILNKSSHSLNQSKKGKYVEEPKKNQRPKLILKFQLNKPDANGAGTSYSHPKHKPIGNKEPIVASHPISEEGNEMQLGRGHRNKGKRGWGSSLLNLDQIEPESPSSQRKRKPRNYKSFAEGTEMQALLAGDKEYTPSLQRTHGSAKSKPASSKRMPPPRFSSVEVERQNIRQMANLGIILALPAQTRLNPNQMAQRQGYGFNM